MLHDNLSDFGIAQDKGPLLYQAIQDGNKEIVNELLSGPIITYSSIRRPDGESQFPFTFAATHPEPDILIKLLEIYKNDIKEYEKCLALKLAAQNGHPAIVTTLLDRCGNEIHTHYKGEALRYAAENGHEAIVTTLLERWGNDIGLFSASESLEYAAQNGHTAIVTTLLERCGYDISADDKGRALRYAAENGHPAIVTTLLERCGNEIHTYYKGEALRYAAENGHTAIVTTLLERCGNEISADSKSQTLQSAAQNGRIEALSALLANESVLALATWNDNAAFRAAQAEFNATEAGTPERARYQAVIDRLMEINEVAEWVRLHENQENNLANIVNLAENSMENLTKNESALVNHLKKHYEPVFEDKSWEVIQVEILSDLKSEYQKSPARDGYHRIWVLKPDSKIPVDFVPADTIGIHPVGNSCTLYSKSLDGTVNQKRVSKEQIEQLFDLSFNEPYKEIQNHELIQTLLNQYDIPAHPNQNQALPLEYRADLNESALVAYYRHPIHNAYRYLSDRNPWMSPDAAFVHRHENGDGQAVISDADKVLMSYFWLALTDESVTLEEGFTLEGNKCVFAATIAELNRGHNCDERALYADEQAAYEHHTPGIQTTRADNLGADKPSCSYGVTKRLLQSQYGHPHLTAPAARPLSLEIIRERMESLLIQSKAEEAAPDNLMDRLNKLDKKELTFVQQQLSDICFMNDYDESDKIILNEVETARVDSAIKTPRAQLDAFIEGTKLWFSKERIEERHDNPKLSTGPGASDFFKDHTSYVAFIEACAQRPLVAFSETLWKAVSAQLETMSPPAPIVNQYARVNKKRKNEERDPCNNDEPDHKKRKPSSP
ncbi:MAG: ankyrin repeat domain-containing protein [Gammaproteobacteria bacterium]